MLVAERLVERVRVGAAMGRVQDEVRGPARACLVLEGCHQELADSSPAETLADHEARNLAAGCVELDEVLDVKRAKARELASDLGHDQERRRVGGDPLDPLRRLFCARRVPELAQQRRESGGVPRARVAELWLYGGGGGRGASGGGAASSSTYVVLLRAHGASEYHARRVGPPST